MDMTIFFVANGAGIIFLLYVLANFWREGRRTSHERREYEPELPLQGLPGVRSGTEVVSQTSGSGASVLPFPSRDGALTDAKTIVSGSTPISKGR